MYHQPVQEYACALRTCIQLVLDEVTNGKSGGWHIQVTFVNLVPKNIYNPGYEGACHFLKWNPKGLEVKNKFLLQYTTTYGLTTSLLSYISVTIYTCLFYSLHFVWFLICLTYCRASWSFHARFLDDNLDSIFTLRALKYRKTIQNIPHSTESSAWHWMSFTWNTLVSVEEMNKESRARGSK